MPYELTPIRPPSEARSLLVRATRNCPWGRCAFCYAMLYNRERFQLRTVEDIKQDILAMKSLAQEITEYTHGYGSRIEQVAMYNGIFWLTNEGVKTAFIGDANSLIMKTEDLAEVIEFLYQTFPTLERVTSYARAKTVLKKTPQELRRLSQAGLSRLHLGLETGDDELLQYVDKGTSAAEMIEAGRRVKEAGISLSEYVILGLGGEDRWKQHAEGTARVLNAIDPDFIRIRTLRILPGTPLEERVEQGEFKLLSPLGILREERLLIELLEVNSEFVSDHVSNILPIDGKLPQAKKEMLERIDIVLTAPSERRASILKPRQLTHL
ncbi:MAG: radical SAM protein [Dehalococcoidia bacterium]|nr:Biotin synthase [Chloroflexota bacterium]MBT9161801.1 Biotin synthase [Chloroflexota bacterium]